MSQKQLQCALKVAELKSFTKAAKKLKISQPTLSQYILNLEKSIGTSIFDRTKAPLELTPIGKFYIEKINKIINLYEELDKDMLELVGNKPQKLRIGLTQTGYTFLLKSLPTFNRKFSHVDLKFTQLNSTSNLKQMVLNDEVDIATLMLPLNKNIFSYKIITRDKIKLALPLSIAQKFKNRKNISLKELENENFILPSTSQRSRKIYDEMFQNAGFKPKIVCETEGFRIANHMASSGLGISFTLEKFVRDDIRDNIKLLNINDTALNRVLVLAYKKNKKLNRITKEFINIAKEALE